MPTAPSQSDLPLVSILTPCFNAERYIRGCIDSIRAQDYPRIEHIVQDGASSDSTLDIVKSYGDGIDWESAPDSGMAQALDRALKRSHGDILLVLNADDELTPGAVSIAVDHLSKHPEIGALYADQHVIDSAGTFQYLRPGPSPYRFDEIFCSEYIIPAQTMYIRRHALENVGFYCSEELEIIPDFDWCIRLGLSYPMLHISEILVRFRVHEDSTSSQISLIDRQLELKEQVIQRVVSDPQTPTAISELKSRARCGLYSWGYSMHLNGPRLSRMCYLARTFARGRLPLTRTLWFLYCEIFLLPVIGPFLSAIGKRVGSPFSKSKTIVGH